MSDKIWRTKEGVEIEYKNLEDSHLLNILKYIKKKSVAGITVSDGGGWDAEEMWYDEYEIYGKEVLELLDYNTLKREAKKRGLLA